MKAILVLDEMPNKCEDCPLYQDPICVGTLKKDFGVWGCYVVLHGEDEKPYWCPLKEMPKKEDYEKSYVEYAKVSALELFHHGFAVGWNSCLKEIEKWN